MLYLYYFAEGMSCMRIEKIGERKICIILQSSSWLTVPSVCVVAGGNDISSCKFRTQRTWFSRVGFLTDR